MTRMKNPPHPGQVLKLLYLEPLKLTVTNAAKALDMPRVALSEIINGKRGISPMVACKLAKAFGGSAESWLNMQSSYDLNKVNPHCTDKVVVLNKTDKPISV